MKRKELVRKVSADSRGSDGALDRWQPAAGVGLNLGPIGLDAAVYTTDTNVERERKPTFALSLRIGRKSSL